MKLGLYCIFISSFNTFTAIALIMSDLIGNMLVIAAPRPQQQELDAWQRAIAAAIECTALRG